MINQEHIEVKMDKKWFRLIVLIPLFWTQASAVVWAQKGNITVFTHVNLVPMTRETIIPNQTVFVKGSRIIAIGPSNSTDIPKEAFIIDGSNAYLVPATYISIYLSIYLYMCNHNIVSVFTFYCYDYPYIPNACSIPLAPIPSYRQ